jgi:hypothetical protein
MLPTIATASPVKSSPAPVKTRHKGKSGKAKTPPARSTRFVADLVSLRTRVAKTPNGKDSVRIPDDTLREVLTRVNTDLADKSFTTVSVIDANGKDAQFKPMELFRSVVFKDRYAVTLDWDTIRAI